jgi:2-polyprenyl-3-methyl-5-hydroxy-6-metoxy-1,4-benzoquinol methylase
MTHPLYDNEALVAQVTRRHVQRGRSVFQLWQTADDDERQHSINVLDRVAPPHRARVLSLGCGVGGMEHYWHQQRPDLRFTLLNSSAAQLDQCLCPGRRVLGDAQDFALLEEEEPYDVTVLAYMLGHVDAARVLDRAMHATGGTVLVLDITKASMTFTRAMHYTPPSASLLRSRGFTLVPTSWWQVSLGWDEDAPDAADQLVLDTEPGMWVCRG